MMIFDSVESLFSVHTLFQHHQKKLISCQQTVCFNSPRLFTRHGEGLLDVHSIVHLLEGSVQAAVPVETLPPAVRKASVRERCCWLGDDHWTVVAAASIVKCHTCTPGGRTDGLASLCPCIHGGSYYGRHLNRRPSTSSDLLLFYPSARSQPSLHPSILSLIIGCAALFGRGPPYFLISFPRCNHALLSAFLLLLFWQKQILSIGHCWCVPVCPQLNVPFLIFQKPVIQVITRKMYV